ncbi:MAG: hypothetical protein ACR2NX_04295 [Chthoniobacterales bacterium]
MKTAKNGVRIDTTEENITITIDALSSTLVRWYVKENEREIADVINGVLAGELGHLHEEIESEFTDASPEIIAEYVMDAIHLRRIVDLRGFSLSGNRPAERPNQFEAAIKYLQDGIAELFGCDFETESGAGTLYISHDGVSMTNPNSSLVGQRASSVARELAKAEQG